MKHSKREMNLNDKVVLGTLQTLTSKDWRPSIDPNPADVSIITCAANKLSPVKSDVASFSGEGEAGGVVLRTMPPGETGVSPVSDISTEMRKKKNFFWKGAIWDESCVQCFVPSRKMAKLTRNNNSVSKIGISNIKIFHIFEAEATQPRKKTENSQQGRTPSKWQVKEIVFLAKIIHFPISEKQNWTFKSNSHLKCKRLKEMKRMMN